MTRTGTPTRSDKTVILSPQSAVTNTMTKAGAVADSRPPPPAHGQDQSVETTPIDVIHHTQVPVCTADQTPQHPAPTSITSDPQPAEDAHETVDVAACGYPTRPSPRDTSPEPDSTSMMRILLPQASDLDPHFEPLPPRRVQPAPSVQVQVETRGRKKGKLTIACTKVPPEPIVPRDEGCDPVSVGKLVWILHEQFPLIVVAQGKAGVGWRTKSNKLGVQCSEGHQWIMVQRIFKHSVPLMFPEPEIGCTILESALPPTQGRHKSIMWSSRHLVSFKP